MAATRSTRRRARAPRARAARGICPYAPSRTRAWTNTYCLRAGHRRAVLTPYELLALEGSAAAPRASHGSVPKATASASDQNTLPSTAACWSSSFSRSAARRSAPRPRPGASPAHRRASAPAVQHARVLLGVERVAAGSLEQYRLLLGREHAAGRAGRETRRAVSSSESGASEIVSAFRFPPPQPGRRSSSSGRAQQTTSSGTPATRSTSPSTKSRRPSSAHCRSSNTSTSRAPLRERFEEATPGGEQPRPGDLRRRRRRRRARRAAAGVARPSPLRLVGTRSSTAAGELVLPRRPRLVLEDARLRLDDLAERPERHALAVRKATVPTARDELRSSSATARTSSSTSRLLPIPGTPTSVTSCGSLSTRARANAPTSERELVLAADERRASRLDRRPRRSASAARPPPRPRPAPPFPWPSTGSASPVHDRPLGRRDASASPTRTPSGGAAAWIRARRVHHVARDHRLAGSGLRVRARRAPRRCATPMRTWSSSAGSASFSAAIASRIASAARTARSGSSSCAVGAPNTPTTASPMNFSTVPP